MVDPSPERARHNHVTRDVKPRGACPGCDRYWQAAVSPDQAPPAQCPEVLVSKRGSVAACWLDAGHNGPHILCVPQPAPGREQG